MQFWDLYFTTPDEMTFTTLAHVRIHLEILCRGRFNLQVHFLNGDSDETPDGLLGTPALIHKATGRRLYGSLPLRENIKWMMS